MVSWTFNEYEILLNGRENVVDSLKKKRILVIDDEPVILQSFEVMFPEYEFIGALSGMKGLEILGTSAHFDLIILDYKMPGYDGLETFERITKITPKIPVIMSTSHIWVKDKAKEIGIKGFLDKPYDLDRVNGVLGDILNT